MDDQHQPFRRRTDHHRESLVCDDRRPFWTGATSPPGDTVVATRRRFLKASLATGAAMSPLAGCATLRDGSLERNVVLGIYDMASPVAGARDAVAAGTRDAFTYSTDNDVSPWSIDHQWVDPVGYNALMQYRSLTHTTDPPAAVGWDTADAMTLAPHFADDEVVFVSPSCLAALHDPAYPYSFVPNLDYTSQARAHLAWVADMSPDARVAFVAPDTPFGNAPIEGATQYARSLGLSVADRLILSTAPDSATRQVETARQNDVDVLVHQNTAPAMETLLRARRAVYPEVTVCGLTWTVDEPHVRRAPEVLEGARYVNGVRTFAEALDADRGGAAIRECFAREDRSLEDASVANVHYVRGFVQALVLVRAFDHAETMGLDIFEGGRLREGMFAIDGWDVWSLAESFDFREHDRRATMTARLYEVDDGSIEHDTTVELPRKEAWIGL